MGLEGGWGIGDGNLGEGDLGGFRGSRMSFGTGRKAMLGCWWVRRACVLSNGEGDRRTEGDKRGEVSLGGGQFGLEGEDLFEKEGHSVGEGGDDGAHGELPEFLVGVGLGHSVQLVDPSTVVRRGGGDVCPGALHGGAGSDKTLALLAGGGGGGGGIPVAGEHWGQRLSDHWCWGPGHEGVIVGVELWVRQRAGGFVGHLFDPQFLVVGPEEEHVRAGGVGEVVMDRQVGGQLVCTHVDDAVDGL